LEKSFHLRGRGRGIGPAQAEDGKCSGGVGVAGGFGKTLATAERREKTGREAITRAGSVNGVHGETW
jgi:hypothetical protein